MKYKIFILITLFTVFIVPFNVKAQDSNVFRQQGIASWYGREYEGRPTASGEIFDSSQLTAAHPSLPFGTMVVVTNQHNQKKVTVRINDRGPFVPARIIDVSRAAAEQLDMVVTGTAPVMVESISKIVMSVPDTNQSQMSMPVNSTAVTQTINVSNNEQSAAAVIPETSYVVIYQPSVTQVPNQIILIPAINIIQDKKYRLQVGSYKIAKNAIEAFDKLKNSGLNPAYERYINGENIEHFRVVLAGINGYEVQLIADKIRLAGFKEALIKEEN